MVHLLMRFENDRPVFTGLAFAGQTMASILADHRNRDKNGFHFVLSLPVDTAGDYDGDDDLADDIDKVHLVIVQGQSEESVVAAFSDATGAAILAEAKSNLFGNSQYVVQNVKVYRIFPPGELDDDGVLAFV